MLPSPSTGITTSISPPSTIAANASAPAPAPAPAPASTSTATPAPGPAAGAATLKRPAAADLHRSAGSSATPTPSKRQATASGNHLRSHPNPVPQTLSSQNIYRPLQASSLPGSVLVPHQPPLQPPGAAATMSMPPIITEDQLLGRTPEQLIATILQIQLQHQQYVAQISAQYESISQQLNDLRGSLVASHQAAATALSTVRDQPMRSIVPPPIPPQQTAVPPPPRPLATQTPNRPRAPPASPGQHVIPRLVSTPQSASAAPPQYDYRTVGTVEEVWKEYREGIEGQPAVEALDAQWGSRWRPEPRGRTWYSRRKVIWDKIKDYISEGMDEEDAVKEVERLRDGGTINKLIRMLQDERKDKGGDDSMTG
ncbi:transcriptional activator of glycolytic enzymes-domain-containing protein [Xylariomycetidae sp. FL0641]|nr:transcriptional activator of glycolytic enzymes-domain-containing protein [Xylariomycetidae sp. FL0641]